MLLKARVDEPALLVLDVTPRDPACIPALLHALGGPGRPAGVVEARAGGDSVTLGVDESISSLRLIVDLVDAELERSPGRRIVPLFGLGDDSLTAFAAATLHAPEIDVSRLIETHTEPLLRGPVPSLSREPVPSLSREPVPSLSRGRR